MGQGGKSGPETGAQEKSAGEEKGAGKIQTNGEKIGEGGSMEKSALLRLLWTATCNLHRATLSPAGDKFLTTAFDALKSQKLPIPEDHIMTLRRQLRDLGTGDVVVDVSRDSYKNAVGTFVQRGKDDDGEYCLVQMPAGHLERWRDRSTIKVLNEIIWISS